MKGKTLKGLFAEAIYRIPDYQRGYAWEDRQWDDFIQDIDALVDEKISSHYTGTVVTYAPRDAEVRDYGTERLRIVDVVDGQQRLTTACLYLSVIIRALVELGEEDYRRGIADFLYYGTVCKLSLANETENLYYDLLRSGHPNTAPHSPHQKRLAMACNFFQAHIQKQLTARGAAGTAYLKELHDAITRRLNFTSYEIEEECEIGMTFELMNSRGKGLSVLELLKNYLMHWISRNAGDRAQREYLTDLTNKNWRDTYANLGACKGEEDQCLRIAWTLYCNHSPGKWTGYNGFKAPEYIPLRGIDDERKEQIRDFIRTFTDGLAEVSRHYATIISPDDNNTLSADELAWLTKIHHTGNIANFLPLMVAARKHREAGSIAEGDYIDLLKALERYAYRVFLCQSRRSNAGKSSFYRWGYEVFSKTQTLRDVIGWINGLTRYYAPEESFIEGNAKPGNWYGTRNRLKYTLFEYELHLLATGGHGKQPRLRWEDLSDSTIEHILPQNPQKYSHWNGVWKKNDFDLYLHDIGNLVLTLDNSSYGNFDFVRKKGKLGQGIGYCNSYIRQEHEISRYDDWTPKELKARREDLVAWISDRWKTEVGQMPAVVEVVDEADEDALEAVAPGVTP